jgi:patatin-like phospholipase/acyl hydrolase
MRPVKVLSLDGGAMKGLVTAQLLRRLEDARPGFLDAVDVFAGTSSGGVLALALASTPRHDPPPAAQPAPRERRRSQTLDAYINLWQTFDLTPVTSTGRLDALTGQGALFSNQELKDGLSRLLPDVNLSELPSDAIIPTFQLDNRNTSEYGERTARPYVYHTFKTASTLDKFADVPPDDWFLHGPARAAQQNVSIIDVAMQSCAAPIVLPVYQGFIDGGLYAANPSMCAIVLLLQAISNAANAQAPLEIAEAQQRLPNIQLLSVGTGRNPTYVAGGDKNWGAVQWLGDVSHPLALIDFLFGASVDIVDLQARAILGPTNYQRLDPVLSEPIWTTTVFTDRTVQSIKDTIDGLRLGAPEQGDVGDALTQTFNTAAAEYRNQDHTLYWLKNLGWPQD